jgi:hypothetical protein
MALTNLLTELGHSLCSMFSIKLRPTTMALVYERRFFLDLLDTNGFEHDFIMDRRRKSVVEIAERYYSHNDVHSGLVDRNSLTVFGLGKPLSSFSWPRGSGSLPDVSVASRGIRAASATSATVIGLVMASCQTRKRRANLICVFDIRSNACVYVSYKSVGKAWRSSSKSSSLRGGGAW